MVILLLAGMLVLNWAVATCAPNCEALAAQGLARQGIESYYPRFRHTSPRFCYHYTRVMPLFPGYLFVRQGDEWRSILGTRGVMNLVMAAGKPALLSDVVIQGVRDREGREGLVELPNPFVVGAKVRVARGGLVDQEGVCAGMDGKSRVFVLLRFLGREVKTRFEKADLVLA